MNPDHQLIEECSTALHLLKHANELKKAREAVRFKYGAHRSREDRNKDGSLYEHAYDLEKQAARVLRRAKKVRATTPEGIYAKALIVRCSKTGATELAMSLAEDMVACTALRAVLWQATASAGD